VAALKSKVSKNYQELDEFAFSFATASPPYCATAARGPAQEDDQAAAPPEVHDWAAAFMPPPENDSIPSESCVLSNHQHS
jgi:hypothetical protein